MIGVKKNTVVKFVRSVTSIPDDFVVTSKLKDGFVVVNKDVLQKCNDSNEPSFEQDEG